jgi:hypothetical protein
VDPRPRRAFKRKFKPQTEIRIESLLANAGGPQTTLHWQGYLDCVGRIPSGLTLTLSSAIDRGKGIASLVLSAPTGGWKAIRKGT